MKHLLKKLLPHLVILVLFIVAALAYFSPVLQGKTIFQSDIAQYQGMAKQLKDYRAETGEETYWTDAAFGGMPTYQLGAKYPHNYIKDLDLAIRFLPRPADYLFLYFIGLYILLLVLKVDYKLAFLGALAFGFSTYLIIILGVGHNAKAHAIAYMPLVLSGILLTFRRKYLYGFLLTTVAMGLQLVANHYQMTYYLLFLVICIGVAYLIDAYKKKQLPHFFKSVGIMVIGVLIAIGLNATNILATKEYADTSTRGKSELTIQADGSPKDNVEGLDYNYITEYSYGILESFNLFIPNFMGGGSSDPLPQDGATQEALLKMGVSPQQASQILNQLPTYWGDQPIVAAPAYIGAVVIFLALLALFLVKGRFKWWIVAAFLLSLFLSWGKNLDNAAISITKNFDLRIPLTEIFIDYVPLYNKFRAVSSIQVIIEVILPVLAVIGLHHYFSRFKSEEKKKKALLYSAGITAGIAIIFILLKSTLLDFSNSFYDASIRENLSLQVLDAVREDRASMLTNDAIRSLIFVILAAGTLWFFLKGKLKEISVVGILAILIVIDLVGVDRRYVNNDDFVQARVMEEPFQKNGADLQIEKDDGTYRVYDATTNAFNSGRASYYHNALGGYHAAKPGRMQDLNEFYISQGNIGMLNMLNVKYIITQGQNGGAVAQRNPYANGNAWFVENVILADNANDELLLLDSLNTKKTAVIAAKFKSELPTEKIARDSTATIDMVSHNPQHIVYETSAKSPQLAVFSEVYYPDGWNAYIDGKPATHYRANYVLRAMTVPEGIHKIEFKFEPKVINTGSTISLFSSILFILIVIGGGFFVFKGNAANNKA
ncbi:YfhO family protein [Marixanthomonas sp. SCSIO 43207]|uniref:YfhO family protein n=1 Tax=Marixanthomonas sp. SCSIO 43207 TaxID=2779360 RepID=UPI001CA7BC2F|nr:YfhO family protein [Marixanthomonas sp. SCSIO 43207]UAB80773.1 YfhO family protein [Marixanthomonas sp. SCSIO 43207]